jgi:hypothetical protein
MEPVDLYIMQCQTSIHRVNIKIDRVIGEYHRLLASAETEIVTNLKLKLEILFLIREKFFSKMNTLLLFKSSPKWTAKYGFPSPTTIPFVLGTPYGIILGKLHSLCITSGRTPDFAQLNKEHIHLQKLMEPTDEHEDLAIDCDILYRHLVPPGNKYPAPNYCRPCRPPTPDTE